MLSALELSPASTDLEIARRACHLCEDVRLEVALAPEETAEHLRELRDEALGGWHVSRAIDVLQAEASAAGDQAQVDLCALALGGDVEARRAYLRAIEEAEAQDDSPEALASDVPPVLEVDDNQVRQSWGAPSLLSSLAMMAVMDLTARTLRVCASDDCTTVYRTTNKESRYCSYPCAHRENERARRASKKGVQS